MFLFLFFFVLFNSEIIGENIEGPSVYHGHIEQQQHHPSPRLQARTSFSFDPSHTRDYVDVSEVTEQLLQSNEVRKRRASSADNIHSPIH
jgi:hypothetical protein